MINCHLVKETSIYWLLFMWAKNWAGDFENCEDSALCSSSPFSLSSASFFLLLLTAFKQLETAPFSVCAARMYVRRQHSALFDAAAAGSSALNRLLHTIIPPNILSHVVFNTVTGTSLEDQKNKPQQICQHTPWRWFLTSESLGSEERNTSTQCARCSFKQTPSHTQSHMLLNFVMPWATLTGGVYAMSELSSMGNKLIKCICDRPNPCLVTAEGRREWEDVKH